MATNLALDPKLLDQVLELSDEQTKKAAVTLALKEFIARREQRKLAEAARSCSANLSGTTRTTTRRSEAGSDAAGGHECLVAGAPARRVKPRARGFRPA